MSDLVAQIAVIGIFQLPPGILPINVGDPEIECRVKSSFFSTLEDVERGLKVDISDCTLFEVVHMGKGEVDITLRSESYEIFHRSLFAISEVIVWSKSKEKVGGSSSFTSQIGTLDVKAFFVKDSTDRVVGWLNPVLTFPLEIASMMSGILPNMIVSNGPAGNPVHPVTRRVMSTIDLINLGFYTEAFVNLFSLVDDLTQEVIKAGMTLKNLRADEQKNLLRSIKEERLKVFLTTLSKRIGWVSLAEANEGLLSDILKVNKTRNNVMHGSHRMTRTEAIEASEVLLKLIEWLKSNPFNFFVPPFPLLRLAEPDLTIFPKIASSDAPPNT